MTGDGPSESTRFFEYGSVDLVDVDARARSACADVRMPFVVMQAATPALLGGGVVDGLSLCQPVSVWIPRLTGERMSPAASGIPSAHERVNVYLRERASEAMKAFMDLAPYVSDPSDLIPFLPMGTYVTFRYRFRIDDALSVIEALEPHHGVAGIAEFQYALAGVLREAVLVVERSSVKRL